MATSAANLQSILEYLSKEHGFSYTEAVAALDSRGLIPAKLLKAPVIPKVETPWASKEAAAIALAQNIEPSACKASGKNGKITKKDVEAALAAPATRINATAHAVKLASDNGIDLSRITKGSGKDGKITKADVEVHVDDEEMATPTPKLSPAAEKLIKQYDLDDDDLKEITPTGKNGAIIAADLKDLIASLTRVESPTGEEE